MGIFNRKKKEPEEVEATVQAKKKTTKTGEDPQVTIQLSGNEMYLANLIQQLGQDVLAVKNEIEELRELINSNL